MDCIVQYIRLDSTTLICILQCNCSTVECGFCAKNSACRISSVVEVPSKARITAHGLDISSGFARHCKSALIERFSGGSQSCTALNNVYLTWITIMEWNPRLNSNNSFTIEIILWKQASTQLSNDNEPLSLQRACLFLASSVQTLTASTVERSHCIGDILTKWLVV